MDLFAHIGQLLYGHNCVIVPGLGGFVTTYRPARLHRAAFEIHPPDKAIAFNPRLNRSDGLLANRWSTIAGITYDEAEEQVEQFAVRCQQRLQKDRMLRFPGVGKLLLEEDQKIRFQPEERENYLEDAYGLPVVKAQPLEFAQSKTIGRLEPSTDGPVSTRAIPYKKAAPVGDKWTAGTWWWSAAAVLLLFGFWQIWQLSITSSRFSLAGLFQGEKELVIEEGRAAFLHPLIPSLQRQMASFGPTSNLSAVTPVAVLPFESELPTPVEGARDQETVLSADLPMDKEPEIPGTVLPTAERPSNQKQAVAETPLSSRATSVDPAALVAKDSPANGSILYNTEGPVPPKGYYLIVGSFPNAREASARLERIREPVGQRAVLLGENGKYRAGMYLSSESGPTEERLNGLRETFLQPDAWIWKHRGSR